MSDGNTQEGRKKPSKVNSRLVPNSKEASLEVGIPQTYVRWFI